ncbi:MAG: LCP family protein [Candidatus Limnocylindria bacterium]
MQRTPAIIIGIVAVVIAAVIGFILISGSPDEPEPSPTPSAEASPSASPSVEASPTFAADLLDRRWTVLYVGTDQNAEREDRDEPLNTDALMLVSLSADQSELTLVSLPRDTVDVPLEDGSVYASKINRLYRDRGMDALVGAMEALFGVPIDGHVLLDMDDFSSLVDAVGMIEVSPDAPLVDPIVNLDLEAGPQEIDATTTLGYVRTRVDQDYGRMGRQQEVVLALVERLTDAETDVDLRSVLDGLDSLETDLPLDELPTMIELVRRASDADVTRVLVEPPLITFEGDRGDGRGYILEPDVEAIRSEVQGLIGEE